MENIYNVIIKKQGILTTNYKVVIKNSKMPAPIVNVTGFTNYEEASMYADLILQNLKNERIRIQ